MAYEIHSGYSQDVLPVINKKFDLVITSPPYNIGKSYEKKTSIDQYMNVQKTVLDAVVPTISERGSICYQIGNYVNDGEVLPLDFLFYDLLSSYDLKLRGRIIWKFGHGLHCKYRFSGRHETILWFSKSDDYIFNLQPQGVDEETIKVLNRDWDSMVWDIVNVKSNHPEKTDHECQFPIELVERCVLVLTDPGSWVLDPFGGVGSTLLGSLMHGRNAVSIDKEEKNCRITKERIDQLLAGKLRTRPMTKEIHVPK